MRAGLKQPAFPRGGWCDACGRGFSGDAAAGKHRRGRHDQERRCLTDDEMVRAGLVLNEFGLWGQKPPRGK